MNSCVKAFRVSHFRQVCKHVRVFSIYGGCISVASKNGFFQVHERLFSTERKGRRVAFVTGSTSGIGLGIAQRLAQNGYDIIITGVASQNDIDNALTILKSKHGVNCTFHGADFTKESEVAQLCTEISRMYPHGIDALVNNAGIQHVAPLEDFPVDIWHKMVAIHLTSSFLLLRYFIPFMKKKGWGRIVNISSINGLIAMPGKGPYCSMKHALIGLTKAVALETAENGITCNAVCPAYVETELVMKQIRDRAKQNNISYEEMRNELFTSSHPTKKSITVEQVAALVGFLCSEEAASVTGCAIPVDAGYTAR
ncbi:hypothetical protein DPMN_139027 [Dreissena polymorpha]|uniref:3-oxoacyl-[acyl-carrier-protein] reductase n=2 Tax=Dreissena polymorpha TaxID=45954 RepID=A0A9D4JJ38_DREPO|nr:hypothetical protein DPMN_139027 [Dreissena polymorpha]